MFRWVYMAAIETVSLVFIDDVNADGSSRIICEMYTELNFLHRFSITLQR